MAETTNAPEPLFRLGVALHKSNQWAQAAEVYAKCVEQKPDWAQAWSNLGVAYLKCEETDRAEAAFGKVLELSPDDSDALTGLSVVYGEQQKTDKLLDVYLRLAEVKRDSLKFCSTPVCSSNGPNIAKRQSCTIGRRWNCAKILLKPI